MYPYVVTIITACLLHFFYSFFDSVDNLSFFVIKIISNLIELIFVKLLNV
jgi:hypothetical protein